MTTIAALPARRAAGADGALIRAVAAGQPLARRRLYERFFDEIHGLLRLCLQTRGEAEEAVCETFGEAFRAAAEYPVLAGQGVADWLTAIALEQVRTRTDCPRMREAVSESLRRAEKLPPPASRPELTPMLEGLSDEKVLILLRTLELPRRQILVMTTILALDTEQAAAIIGVDPRQAERLRTSGLDDIWRMLSRHRVREEAVAEGVLRAAYQLRPNETMGDGYGGGKADGNTIARGTKVHYEPRRNESLLALARKAVQRFLDKLRRGNDQDHDSNTGPPLRKRRVEPTPTLQPFTKPKPTAGQRSYEMPEQTRGIATYRTPGQTPSTARLSNPRRPLASGARHQGWSGRL